MTDVVEAMGSAIENQMACDDNTPTDLARAAIRALPPGWVVAKVPEEAYGDSDMSVGFNACRDAVRAAAVEVE